jgi:HD-GYP domain-containing protein (c-di-GMP phosphodiesterase class II)/HAMP domain-containing protein
MADIAQESGAKMPGMPGLATPSHRPPQGQRRLRLPLQLVATVGVVAFLALIVSLLSWQAYRGAQEALISVSNDTVGYIRDTIAEKAKRILEPAEAQLDFFARNPISQAATLSDRLQQIPVLADALQRDTLIDAMYAGYPDGEFILFRPLRSAEDRKRFAAPLAATLLVQSITAGADGKMIGEYRLYDARNQLLSSQIDPAYHFDPRGRAWYQSAATHAGVVMTDPYVFFTTDAIGITMAQQTLDGGATVGLDAKMSSIATQISQLRITASSDIALVNKDKQVIAYRDSAKMIIRGANGSLRLASVSELQSPPLSRAAELAFSGSTQNRITVMADGRSWQAIQTDVDINDTHRLKLLIAIPNDEFFAAARQLVWHQVQIAGLIMLLAIPVAWWLTRQLVTPLRRLANETAKIERFDFTTDVKIRSYIGEINDLGRALERMRRTIRKFLKIGHALAGERDFKPLLDRVLRETIDVVRSDGGAIYMVDDDQRMLTPEIIRWRESRIDEEEAGAGQISLNHAGIFDYIADALHRKEIVVVEQRLDDRELASLGLREMVDAFNADRLALVIVPLLDRNQVPLGILILAKAIHVNGKPWIVDEQLLQLIHAVSGAASVSIQNKLLLEAQRKLIDSLIKLVAGAIDAKSAYTGGHCQRVPALTRMLAETAVQQTQGPFAAFSLSADEWEALDIASWLHDCGKVTTPEYVVDKATKLETIYDRIHEIRTRFEVLKRDAEIAYWRGMAAGDDPVQLQTRLSEQHRQLDEDFAFVARSNIGGEFMEEADVDRLKTIAERRWTRTLSNRLGVSHEELARFEREPEPGLPVEEPLLADRVDQIISHRESDLIPTNNPWGFHLNIPQHRYNRGEIYNLSVSRGTLTAEERYCINDHIVQTIMMLESLPFPKHLKAVPELAGGHHEKMDGTGYPKRLKGSDMSTVARMMAIADVFEALTAADRPYKKAKKISDSIKIMGFMKRDNHLDPDLLDLFLTTGIWRNYAERFLQAQQIDEPDIEAVLKIRPRPI